MGATPTRDIEQGPDRDQVQAVVRTAWQRTTIVVVAAVVLLLLAHGLLAARLDTFGSLRILVGLTTVGLTAVVALGMTVVYPLISPEANGKANPMALFRELESARSTVQELEQANQALSEFAHVIRHDLKEPLRMIRSYVQLLDDRYREDLDEEAREYLDQAGAGAQRMDELLEGLTAYAQAGGPSLDTESVDLETTVEEAVENLSLRVDRADAEIDVGPLPTVEADPVGLRQVFQNLIGNPIKFSRDDVAPVVQVRAERENGVWRIDVSDNGVGFDPDEADDLFEIFHRGSATDQPEGTGVGLSVVDRIVTGHGGSVEATSTPGEGSTFSVRLPSTREERERDIEERSRELV